MTDLFDNAVASIRMGVEDFQRQDPERDVSAVRNVYAGVLLLAKEALIRAVPDADPDLVIAARLKPVPDEEGGLKLEQTSKATVDFGQLGERAKDFGVPLDPSALKTLNRIRNDMEHRCSTESVGAIREAISMAFPVAAGLFKHIEEDPIVHLGEAWAEMLNTKKLYDIELAAARETLKDVKWISPSIDGSSFRCPDCRSDLIEQIESENEVQEHVELKCRSCGTMPELGVTIENALEDLFGADSYIRARDSAEDGPLYSCPACSRHTIIETELTCAACGETIDFDHECIRCSNGISIQDYLDGLDGGLCSYCTYVSEKALRE
ncbi:hypothetical protein RA28_19705 [Ruegeria sp. ANG-S4]|uniref:hypothetical protein n=1 Tax=Ruegeria sp. ANG-S4 TaxID=1577904 RepID=UPI00057F45E3|nr:hypothetical protein [Ruegeria sp. ANG-S4]KIC43853.1 hypothetical protein RA28_19705 [Ruegeria sp. ANG-S4]